MLRKSGLKLVFLLGAAAALCAQAEPPGAAFNRIGGEARAAREARDYPAYLARIRELVALLPGHSAMHYSLARGLSLAGDRAGAIAALGRIAEQGYGYDAAADPSFESLRGDPAFTAVVERLAANRATIGTAGPSHTLGLAGQQPEGIASLGGGSFLLGALRGGIYRIDPGAAPRLLASAGASVVGIRPDPASGTFLACISDEAGGSSMVQRRRIADGALVASYPFPAERTFCNDVVIVPGGFVATDSTNGILYRLRGDRVEAIPGAQLVFANGIAADPSGATLYVASGNGIVAVDLATGRTRLLAQPRLLGGIDGMVWHDGALIAVQNVTQPERLLRITPPQDGGDARIEVLLSGHPQLAGSTTVAIDGNDAVVISQTGIPNGTLPDDPILLRVPLTRR